MKTILILLFFLSTPLIAQEVDKIYLKNKEMLSGKVLRVTEKNVEIDPEGNNPFIIIKREDINVIIYSDNTVVNFNESNEDINNNSVIKEAPRIDGFRTDGYYINKFPFDYKYRKELDFLTDGGEIMVNSSMQNLYIAFRINPSAESEDDNYREIQAAMFIERKSKMKKALEDGNIKTWKDVHELFLNREKIDRDFKENDLRKKKRKIMAVQFKWDSLFTIISDQKGISLMIKNFTGLEQDIPRADFRIGKTATKMVHPKGRKESHYDEVQWNPYFKKMFDPIEATNRKFWLLFFDTELVFVPDLD